jgi:hypothetical protein
MPGDLLTDKAKVKGSTYRADNIIVTEVRSCDVLEVGVIKRIVLRGTEVIFIVSLHDAARDRYRFFKTVPCDRIAAVSYAKLADYKPLVKRGRTTCFHFILHHHIPTPIPNF